MDRGFLPSFVLYSVCCCFGRVKLNDFTKAIFIGGKSHFWYPYFDLSTEPEYICYLGLAASRFSPQPSQVAKGPSETSTYSQTGNNSDLSDTAVAASLVDL